MTYRTETCLLFFTIENSAAGGSLWSGRSITGQVIPGNDKNFKDSFEILYEQDVIYGAERAKS